MKLHVVRSRALLATSALCLLVAPVLRAQTAAPAPAAASPEETLVLSPFVVEAAEDSGGYAAKSTLAGTRVRTDLKDVSSAISVVTTQFLKDTGAKNNDDLLVYTPSTEVAGIRGNFSGNAGTAIYAENTVSTATRVRGLDSADNTRDYFLTSIPWDGFNVGRVDLQRGPNSILFGIGSPAGIINTSTNDAAFKTSYNVEDVVGQYGSLRNSIDLNQSVLKGVLALRFAAVKDDKKFEQSQAYNDTVRYHAALRFEPKLFVEGSHTSLRVKYEDGKVRSDNPRALPPVDEMTPWFKTGKDAYGNPYYNKLTINQFSLTNPNPSGVPLPGATGAVLPQATYELGGWAQSRSYWPDVINYYEATPASINTVPNAPNPTGTPIKTIVAQANAARGLSSGGGIAGLTTFRPMGIPSYSQYAAYVGPVSDGNGHSYPGAPIPGGVYYADTVLTDPSIFNFYKNLLDGPNKKEWQNWSSLNLALDQSFFHDRLAFQVAFDHQSYDEGSNQWMTGSNYAINIDINATYADGTPNPNVGRPYVANAASNANYITSNVRDTFRFTGVGDVRASDLLGDNALAKILGRHVITGLYERYNLTKNDIKFAEFATTPDYVTFNFPNNTTVAASLGSNRSFEWLAYVGPSLATATSAANAHLANLSYTIEPPAKQGTLNFDATWNKSPVPGNANYVDPAAPYTYTNLGSGVTSTGTQVDNPANYIGWTNQQISWMRSDDPHDYPSLVTSASRTKFRDTSKGLTWQGYLLDGDLVPAFGWRKDSITNYQTNAISDPNTAFTSLNYPDNLSSRTDVQGTSKSWGAVYHLPKSIISKLPGDSTVSVHYNHSKNFKADASRLSLAGLPIPNAAGDTKEYGFTVTTLHDKLSLKVDWFKTKVANATLAETAGNSIGGLGNNAYFIADGSIWGYAWAAALQDGLRGKTPNSNYWDYGLNDDGYDANLNNPTRLAVNAKSQAIVDAWLKAPFPSSFFSSYALTPALDPTIGAKTGNLRDSYPGGYDDSTGPNPGGGSNFGNHQITVDNLSKGTEIELTAQPIKNWNLTVNYSKVQATHENIDQAAQDFMGTMTKFMNGPGGQVREWYNGGGTLGAQWNSSLVAPFTVQLNELGHAAPEVSPWRLNLVSGYSFDQGALKGVNLGGAFRTEAGRIIGYHYSPTFKNANSADPNYATNLITGLNPLTLGGLDVNQPFIGSNESHLDAWLGYSRKFGHDVNWRIQLNLRSVGEKDRLVAARIQPDGSIALARIVQGMGWQLTNSFDF